MFPARIAKGGTAGHSRARRPGSGRASRGDGRYGVGTRGPACTGRHEAVRPTRATNPDPVQQPPTFPRTHVSHGAYSQATWTSQEVGLCSAEASSMPCPLASSSAAPGLIPRYKAFWGWGASFAQAAGGGQDDQGRKDSGARGAHIVWPGSHPHGTARPDQRQGIARVGAEIREASEKKRPRRHRGRGRPGQAGG